MEKLRNGYLWRMDLKQGREADILFFQYPIFLNCYCTYIKQNERKVINNGEESFSSNFIYLS